MLITSVRSYGKKALSSFDRGVEQIKEGEALYQQDQNKGTLSKVCALALDGAENIEKNFRGGGDAVGKYLYRAADLLLSCCRSGHVLTQEQVNRVEALCGSFFLKDYPGRGELAGLSMPSRTDVASGQTRLGPQQAEANSP